MTELLQNPFQNQNVDGRRAYAPGVALSFLLAVGRCGAVAAKECPLCFPVVLPKLDCFPVPRLSSFALPEYGRSGMGKPSGCHAGVRAGVPLLARSFCRPFIPDAVSLACSGCVRLPRS